MANRRRPPGAVRPCPKSARPPRDIEKWDRQSATSNKTNRRQNGKHRNRPRNSCRAPAPQDVEGTACNQSPNQVGQCAVSARAFRFRLRHIDQTLERSPRRGPAMPGKRSFRFSDRVHPQPLNGSVSTSKALTKHQSWGRRRPHPYLDRRPPSL